MREDSNAWSPLTAPLLELCDELLEVGERVDERLLPKHLVGARADVDGPVSRLVGADDEDEVVLRELRVAD